MIIIGRQLMSNINLKDKIEESITKQDHLAEEISYLQKDAKPEKDVNEDFQQLINIEHYPTHYNQDNKLQNCFQKWTYKQQYFNFFQSAIHSLISQQPQSQPLNLYVLNNDSQLNPLYNKFSHMLIKQNFRINKRLELKNPLLPLGFSLKVINTSNKNQVFELLCSCGIYEKNYIVLKTHQESVKHLHMPIASGGMGKVFPDFSHKIITQKLQQMQIVSKCLEFQILDFSHPTLKAIVWQIFLTDLMSALEIGPKIVRSTGFDFIIFQNCVEFDMEKCQPLRIENLQNNLKQNLLSMHLIKAVHSDIKPDNCMYSPSFKKNIFIDFGITELLPYFLGSEVLSMFKGTYQYCSEDMKRLLSKKKPELTDLYKNDTEMLEKSLQIMRKQLQTSSISFISIAKFDELENQYNWTQKQRTSEQNARTIYYLHRLKYHLYVHQQKPKVSEQMRICLLQITNCLFNDRHNEFIIGQARQFIVNELNRAQHCLNLLLTECKILNLSIFDSYFEIYSALQSQSKTKNINKTLLQGGKLIQTYLERSTSMGKKYQIKRNNLQAILLNEKEIKKFKLEEYLQLFLIYVSFWKSTYKVSIEDKERVAKSLRQVISECYDCGQCEFQKQKYLPEEEFIKTNCKDIVWVYGFMLSYCMQANCSRFKTDNFMLVLKDCILLNFKYYRFVEKCEGKWIERLIRENNKSIIANVIVNTIELVWLVSMNFAIFSETELRGFEDNQKYSVYSLRELFRYLCLISLDTQAERLQLWMVKKLLIDLYPFHLRELHEKQVLTIKLLPQENFSSDPSKPNQHQKVGVSQMVRKLVQLIEEEFESVNKNSNPQNYNQTQISMFYQNNQQKFLSEDNLMLYSKAIYCVTFAQTFFGKFQQQPKKQLGIFSYSHNEQYDSTLFQFFHKYNHLKQHLNTEISMFQSLVVQIDEKIKCQSIARCLRMDLRIRDCLKNENYLQLIHLIKLLTYNRWATVNANNSLLNSQVSYRRFFIFLEEYPSFKKGVMMKYNFLNIIAENYLSMIPPAIGEGNFFKVWSIFEQIPYLLIINQNYFELQDLKVNFSKIKEFVVEKVQYLYGYYHLNQKSFSPVPILGLQSFRLLQSLETLKIQLSMEHIYTVGYFSKLKQIFRIYQSLYKTNQGILRIIPIKDCKIEFWYSFRSMLSIVFELINQTYHHGEMLIRGWKNIMFSLKNYSSVFSPQISKTFHHLFINIFASGEFKILTQSVLIVIKQIMTKNIISSYAHGFNTTLKIAIANEKQRFKKFLEIFFKEVKKPFGNNFSQKLCLCLFYINILDFSEYFENHPYLWKRLLTLLCRNFEMYPKFAYQPQDLSQQRYHKVVLITIKYLNYLGKMRKRNIFIRTFVKRFKGSNRFYGLQAIEWIKRFINSEGVNIVDHRVRSKIQKKKLQYLQNVIQGSQQSHNVIQSRKMADFYKILQRKIFSEEYLTHSYGLQMTIAFTNIEKQLKQHYHIPILYPISKLHTPALIKLMEAKTEFKSEKNQNLQLQSYEGDKNFQTQQRNFKFRQIIKQGSLRHETEEMRNFIWQIKNSKIYQVCRQVTQLALDLINEEKRWLENSRFKIISRSSSELNINSIKLQQS